jgi:8-oxo-dGTP pyrophosphatase MutT (NUDIX family)
VTSWPAIAAARTYVADARVPFYVDDERECHRCGSVARTHLHALARWPDWLHVEPDRVTLRIDSAGRDTNWALLNAELRAAGLIVAWRDETYPVIDLDSGEPLATIERAASRFWGTLTVGAHCNGYVADAAGRPTHLWIARRAWNKATDPGKLDNLIGGGVPHGQAPREAVVREGWEEAGLVPEQMRCLSTGRVLLIERDIVEGFQREQLHVFDLALPADLAPRNQDGEVAELQRMPIAQALRCAAGDEMTVDASLVTLDFALRHALLHAGDERDLAARMSALWVHD